MEDISLGRTVAKALRRGYAAEQMGHVIVCENCREVQGDSGEQPFMCCAICRQKMNRKIFYCSKLVSVLPIDYVKFYHCDDRECQKEDWKPRHKLVCGKHLTVRDAEATAVPPLGAAHTADAPRAPVQVEIIGPVVGGFKRSPALRFQINNITYAANKIDYILVNPTGRPRAVNIEHALEKCVFRSFRDKAFTTGDHRAVAAVGQFLVKDPGGPFQAAGVTRKAVLTQLRREFQFDVEAAVDELDRERAGGGTEVEKMLMEQYFMKSIA
jgi:hypothetical protein